jgi:hypothetical protein
MKNHIAIIFIIFMSLTLCKSNLLYSQAETAIVAPTTEAGENLDLMEVLAIFKEAENLEDFERKLNEEGSEVNNIDLNQDGEVDYLRVVEFVEGNTHVIVLQATIGEDQYQDVASIVIDKNEQGDISVQAIGDEEIYGEEYIVEEVEVQTIVIVTVVYSPGYTVYVSPYSWGRYPSYYRHRKAVTRSAYKARKNNYNKAKYRQTRNRRSTRGKSVYAKNHKSSNMAKTGASKQQQPKQQPKQQQAKQQPKQQQTKQQPKQKQKKKQPKRK